MDLSAMKKGAKQSLLLSYLLLVSRLDRCKSLSSMTRRKALIALSSPFLASAPGSDALEDVEWVKGTQLPHLDPVEAVAKYGDEGLFPMGQWPDPILRKNAKSVPPWLLDSDELRTLARMLRNTSRNARAVGLSAQQCGIDASLVFLEVDKESSPATKTLSEGLFLVNPRIVYRSPEIETLVWEESCLVLPPSFRATTLRDRRVVIEAETLEGSLRYADLEGEMARAAQHECQHDEGILLIDHVDLDDECVSEQMRRLERGRHEERQARAFQRDIAQATCLDCFQFETKPKFRYPSPSLVFPANAAEMEKALETPTCDQACRQRIEDRRALARQSRTTRSRQELFELSRQRAAMYNTTYQGVTCPPTLPCY